MKTKKDLADAKKAVSKFILGQGQSEGMHALVQTGQICFKTMGVTAQIIICYYYSFFFTVQEGSHTLEF